MPESLALVVENDLSTRKLLEAVMARSGYEVDGIANGLDALVLLSSIDYSLIVLDLFLPGATGDEVLQWLSNERPAAIERSIVLSAAPLNLIEQVRAAYPKAKVIRKPFELQQLVDIADGTARHQTDDSPADRFLRRSVVAGAKAGLVVRKNGSDLSLFHKFGYAPNVAEQWFPLSPREEFPLCQCVREGRPQWLASLGAVEPEFPDLSGVWRENQSRALAAVPLLHKGEILGAAGWSFRDPQPFDEREQLEFMAIAADVAAAMAAMQPGHPVLA
jgi:CheY-like chemotaxis protein